MKRISTVPVPNHRVDRNETAVAPGNSDVYRVCDSFGGDQIARSASTPAADELYISRIHHWLAKSCYRRLADRTGSGTLVSRSLPENFTPMCGAQRQRREQAIKAPRDPARSAAVPHHHRPTCMEHSAWPAMFIMLCPMRVSLAARCSKSQCCFTALWPLGRSLGAARGAGELFAQRTRREMPSRANPHR